MWKMVKKTIYITYKYIGCVCLSLSSKFVCIHNSIHKLTNNYLKGMYSVSDEKLAYGYVVIKLTFYVSIRCG